MNKKGQALVEFVIILPILLLLILGSIDIGRIITSKNELENIMSECIRMYNDNKSIDEIKYFVKINNQENDAYIINEDNKKTLVLSSKIDLIAPGINKILGSPYEIINKRVINYE